MTAVSVTAGHIARGRPRNCADCPVAIAVRVAFPEAAAVIVGDRYISMYSEGQLRLLIIPEDVRALIGAFDHGDHVEPFTFELDYPAVTR